MEATVSSYAQQLKKGWYWTVIIGVIMLIGGIFSLMNPLAASLTIELIVGWTFIFVGIFNLIQAFSRKGAWDIVWVVLMGILGILLGWSLLANPLAGIVSLTAVVGTLILLNGILKLVYGWKMRPFAGWVWMMIAGVISIVLAIFIFNNLFQAALVTLGVLVAIDLISSGILMIMLGLRARKLP
ncbi:MAG: HdeD family acid-resistance protein [Thiolinea sp.]